MSLRVFLTKGVARFQRREKISGDDLCHAIREAERGIVDADLGSGLIKLRVARKGKGKSGGFRLMVAYRAAERAVLLYGFAKNDRDNVDDDELSQLRLRARGFLGLDEMAIAELIRDGDIKELECDEEHEG